MEQSHSSLSDLRSGSSEQRAYKPRTAVFSHKVVSLPNSEAIRLEKRRQLVGQIIALPPEWQDPLNPDNPYALDPTFPWTTKQHSEFFNNKYGLITEEGFVLKSYARSHLPRLSEMVKRTTPIIRDFNIPITHFYGKRGLVRVGDYEKPIIKGDRYLPGVITLDCVYSTRTEATYNAIHELAHASLAKRTRWKRPGEKHRDYQPSLHDEDFSLRFGELLAAFINLPTTTTHERRMLLYIAEEDYYGQPIFPDGTVQVSYPVGECQS